MDFAARFFINGLDATRPWVDLVAADWRQLGELGTWNLTAASNCNETKIDKRVNDLESGGAAEPKPSCAWSVHWGATTNPLLYFNSWLERRMATLCRSTSAEKAEHLASCRDCRFVDKSRPARLEQYGINETLSYPGLLMRRQC